MDRENTIFNAFYGFFTVIHIISRFIITKIQISRRFRKLGVPSGPITGPEGAKTPANRFLRSNNWTGGLTHR